VADIRESEHGTTYGYRKGCRCGPCREAKREDWRRYKERQAANQVDPFDDFEGMAEPDQIAEMVKTLVLRVRCECGDWHEAGAACPLETPEDAL
jgi:hypothetical protein